MVVKRFGLLLMCCLLSACAPQRDASHVFRYDGTKVGDHVSVVKIAEHLPFHDCYESVELQTKHRPYGLTVRYTHPTVEEQALERFAIENAAVYFTLVDNAEIVRFAFPNRTYAFSRPEMEAWFETDFSTIRGERELFKRLEQKMPDESHATSYFKQV